MSSNVSVGFTNSLFSEGLLMNYCFFMLARGSIFIPHPVIHTVCIRKIILTVYLFISSFQYFSHNFSLVDKISFLPRIWTTGVLCPTVATHFPYYHCVQTDGVVRNATVRHQVEFSKINAPRP
jgi:hypothetical protein